MRYLVVFLFMFSFMQVVAQTPEPAKASSAPVLNVNDAVKFLEAKEQILEKWGNTKAKKGSAEFRKKDVEMKKVIDELMDYQFIAKHIIGEKWGTTSVEKKDQFFAKIKELFTELYLEKAFYNKSYEKKYIDKGSEKLYIKGIPESVFITSEIQAAFKGKPVIYELIYHLRIVDGTYKIFDIELDTVSLVRNYKEQFTKNVKDQSIDELIKMIDKKIKNKDGDGSFFSPKKDSR
ncbi:MAG TPA: ABC transporter substrate-binding protein [bacterium]|nr:ABC transporter substrate-binding protein [bacterium]HPS29260.1 ABC transporter substrate-binding protein [bacterium]